MKEGDRVVLHFKSELTKNGRKKYHLSVLKLLEAINGKTGVITEIVSDEEIWVRGDRTGVERMFNKATLRELKE
jgi:hypothetical protein